MPTKYLHFDTYFANYINNPTNTATQRPNAYECQFVLPAQIRNVRRVALKSAEMPITFGQTRGSITRSDCTGYFAIKINGTQYAFNMFSRTYTTIASFITDLNDSYTTYVGTPSGAGGVFSTYTSPGASANQYTLLLTFPQTTTVVFIDTVLSRSIMGFNNSIDSGVGLEFAASGRFNLNADNFVAMHIRDIPNAATSVSSKPCTFKIPMSVAYDSVLYFNDSGNGFTQWVDIPASYGYTMDRITVAIYDRWGFQINPWGGDYTFTLAVDYDDSI